MSAPQPQQPSKQHSSATIYSTGSRSGIYLSVAHHRRQDRLVVSWCTSRPRLCDSVSGEIEELPSQQLIAGYVCDSLSKAFSSGSLRTLLAVRRLANTTPLPFFVELLDASSEGAGAASASGEQDNERDDANSNNNGTAAASASPSSKYAYVHVSLFLSTLHFLQQAMMASSSLSGRGAAGGGGGGSSNTIAINFVGCSFRRCGLTDRELTGLCNGLAQLVQEWRMRATVTAKMPMSIYAIPSLVHNSSCCQQDGSSSGGGLSPVDFCFGENRAVSTASIPPILRSVAQFVDAIVDSGSRRTVSVNVEFGPGTEAALHHASPQIAASTCDLCSQRCGGGVHFHVTGLPPLPAVATTPKQKKTPVKSGQQHQQQQLGDNGATTFTSTSGDTRVHPRSSSAPNHNNNNNNDTPCRVVPAAASASAVSHHTQLFRMSGAHVPKTVDQLMLRPNSSSNNSNDALKQQQEQAEEKAQVQKRRLEAAEREIAAKNQNALSASRSFFSLYELVSRYVSVVVAEQRLRAQLVSRWTEELDLVFGAALSPDDTESVARHRSVSAAQHQQQQQQQLTASSRSNSLMSAAAVAATHNKGTGRGLILTQVADALIDCNGMVLSLRRSTAPGATPLLQELETTVLPLMAQAASAAIQQCAIARPSHLRSVMGNIRDPLLAGAWCGTHLHIVESCPSNRTAGISNTSCRPAAAAAAAVSDEALSALCSDVFSAWSSSGGNPAVVVGRAFDVVEAALEPLRGWEQKIGAVEQGLLREASQIMSCHIVLAKCQHSSSSNQSQPSRQTATSAAASSREPSAAAAAVAVAVAVASQQGRRSSASQPRQARAMQPRPAWGYAAGGSGRSSSPGVAGAPLAAVSQSRSSSACSLPSASPDPLAAQPHHPQRQRKEITKMSVRECIALHTNQQQQPQQLKQSSVSAASTSRTSSHQKQQQQQQQRVSPPRKLSAAAASPSSSSSSSSTCASPGHDERPQKHSAYRLPEPTCGMLMSKDQQQQSQPRQTTRAKDDGARLMAELTDRNQAQAPLVSPTRLQLLRNGWWRGSTAQQSLEQAQVAQAAQQHSSSALAEWIDVDPPLRRQQGDASLSPEPLRSAPPVPTATAAKNVSGAKATTTTTTTTHRQRSSRGREDNQSNARASTSFCSLSAARAASEEDAVIDALIRPAADYVNSQPSHNFNISPRRLLRALLDASSRSGSATAPARTSSSGGNVNVNNNNSHGSRSVSNRTNELVDVLRTAVSLAKSQQREGERYGAVDCNQDGYDDVPRARTSAADSRARCLTSMERVVSGAPWLHHFEQQQQQQQCDAAAPPPFTPPRFNVARRRQQQEHRQEIRSFASAPIARENGGTVHRQRDVALIDRLLARQPVRRFLQPGEQTQHVLQQHARRGQHVDCQADNSVVDDATSHAQIRPALAALSEVSLNRATGVAADLLKGIRTFAEHCHAQPRIPSAMHQQQQHRAPSLFAATIVDPFSARQQTEVQRKSLELHSEIAQVLGEMAPQMRVEAERRARELVSQI